LLNEGTAEYTREVLSEKSLEKAGLFDARKVSRLLRKLETLDSPSEIDSMALVGILSSQLVHHQFIQDFPARAANSISPTVVVDRRSEALRAAN
jgi:asparagine synthase (glutamine-hydrolysing)